MSTRLKNWLTTVLMVATYAAFLYIFIPLTVDRFNYWMLDIDHITSQGTVIQTFRCNYGDRLIIQFKDLHGETVTSQESLCQDKRYRVGEQVTIYYRPAAPTYIALRADLNSGGGIIFFVGLGFDLGAVVAIIYAIRRALRLQQKGDGADAPS